MNSSSVSGLTTHALAETRDVFLSYRHRDGKEFAQKLHAALVKRGFRVWFDEVTMLAGHELDERIKAAIGKVGLYIAIISPHFCEPDSFAFKEFGQAVNVHNDRALSIRQETFIVPILHGLKSHAEIQSNTVIQRYLATHIHLNSTDPLNTIVDWVLRAFGVVEDACVASGITGFEIGRFPVTNIEYRRIINDGAYTNAGLKKWWSNNGQQFWLKYALREPHDHCGQKGESVTKRTEDQTILANMSATHPLFDLFGQPVTGVSFYEAEAYCNWLTAKHCDSNSIVRLPHESEWLASAMTKGVKYPWGDEAPSSDRINIVDKVLAARENLTLDDVDLQEIGKINVPSVFAAHPRGISPSGCHDMFGNVWEWLGDWIDEKQAVDWTGDQFNLAKIAGYCCFDPPDRLRELAPIQYRRPGYRHHVIGFRIARETRSSRMRAL